MEDAKTALKVKAFDLIQARAQLQTQSDYISRQLDGLLRQINSTNENELLSPGAKQDGTTVQQLKSQRESVPTPPTVRSPEKAKTKPLHKKTQKAYDAVFTAIKNGNSRHSEIMKESGISTNAVYKMISLLEKSGKIVKNAPGKYVAVENDDDGNTEAWKEREAEENERKERD